MSDAVDAAAGALVAFFMHPDDRDADTLDYFKTPARAAIVAFLNHHITQRWDYPVEQWLRAEAARIEATPPPSPDP